MNGTSSKPAYRESDSRSITIFLSGDVMTGRGIDQVMPHPSDPVLYEPYITDARDYGALAERANGPIRKPVSHSYIWEDVLEDLERMSPHLRIVNLETSITTSNEYWRGKGINYRMHPENVPCITAAKIDLCTLANNHALDWGYTGLIETLETLRKAGIRSAGAGGNRGEAEAPSLLDVGKMGRVVVFAFGSRTSGVPLDWEAGKHRPGVNLLQDFSDRTVSSIARNVREVKQHGDIAIASIHWGGNWGFAIPSEHIEFAHNLIDRAGIDVIWGHSSHHVQGIEVYRNKPVLYGCGDLLDDYEGIGGYEVFRGDLSFLYFVSMDPMTGDLVRLEMTPTRIKNFKVSKASTADVAWLRGTLNREGRQFGTRVELSTDNTLTLQWV